MASKLLSFIVLVNIIIVLLFSIENSSALGLGRCPDSARISSCTSKCKDDSNCHGSQICCTNICGTKSCSDMNQYLNDNKGSKGSNSKSGSGSYCGNTKCSAYEKCELDRTTKREKCVRS